MKEPQINFIELLIKLLDNKVEFVLVGGLAAATYGSPQVTHDTDICINLSVENLIKIKDALSGLNPKHRMHPARPSFNESEKKLVSFKNIYLETDLGQLDCLGNIKGIGDFNKVLAVSQNIELQDRKCKILSLPALIKAKEAMGRAKDKESVIILKAIMDEEDHNV